MKETVVCLVSGGIDSPVACVLASRMFKVVPLHFCIYPFTCEENFFIAMTGFKKLKERIGFEKVVVFPWGNILEKILEERKGGYSCLVCRKSMFRAAEMVCEREGASGIVTGESLGQKASQTLSNLGATTRGIKFPIIRPLLGLDKNEIEEISKGARIWQERHAGCCYATPKYPRTRAKAEIVDKIVEELGVPGMILENLGRIMEVKTFEEDFEGYLLSLA
ncbi:MAG: hypothetical protein APU95_01125 [Hadesarchaea archaeon YNP_N21]|nr:MAG: hypothetical protein APU95_01125 [Hadesarchaea archaeon YNP_N21]